MLSQSSASQHRKDSSPFVFEEIKDVRVRNIMGFERENPLFVSTKPSENEHLPFPKDYQFKPCFLPDSFLTHSNAFRDCEVWKDDVWVLSFPKTGTTWLLNIVSQLKHGLDITRKPVSIGDVLFLEWPLFMGSSPLGEMGKPERAVSPRILKSHFPPNLLPVELWTVQPKMIYIARNPKDAAISMYHMLRNTYSHFTETLEQYLDLFLDDKCMYGPFSRHILSFWQLRHSNNFLFLTYEELSTDTFKEVKRIAAFLECKWSDEDLKKLTEYVSFDNMQKMNTEGILQDEISNIDPRKLRFVYNKS